MSRDGEPARLLRGWAALFVLNWSGGLWVGLGGFDYSGLVSGQWALGNVLLDRDKFDLHIFV